MIFTASHSIYANRVIDELLDPEGKLISHRLCREHCSQTEQGYFIKDICTSLTSHHQPQVRRPHPH
jgi:CTD small phosphatase-like protein 2